MQKLAEVVRGPIIENIHFGSIQVSDEDGNIIASAGDDIKTYLRSSAKPLQLIPLVESDAKINFGFTNKELAIMAGSHYGTAEHVEVISSILSKLNLPPDILQCGIHDPFSRTYAQELQQKGISPTVLNNNCSGKHSAMLALCKLNNWDYETYTTPNHPVQKLMLRTISEMSSIPEQEIAVGIDGCGVPVFGFRLSAMARAFAKLGSQKGLPERRAKACHTICNAMRENPIMVAGEGALDTAILSLPDANLISKIGAEAVFCIAVPEKSLGIAIKIYDGNQRILGPVVVDTLKQLNLLTAKDEESLQKFQRIILKNFAKNPVGEIRASFALRFN